MVLLLESRNAMAIVCIVSLDKFICNVLRFCLIYTPERRLEFFMPFYHFLFVSFL